MSALPPTRRTWSESVYALLLYLYPSTFREKYGEELRATFRDWRGEGREGVTGLLAFGGAVLLDVLRSAPQQWADTIRAGLSATEPPGKPRPSYLMAAVAGVCVFSLYALTLAPSIGFWDSGEYTAAAHTLGIPHPPGSPLFVLLVHAWDVLLSPTGLSPAVRINLFSAFLSAASHAFWFLVVERALLSMAEARWMRWIGASAAVVLSATTFTVWNQSNVNEKVYSISFFTTALVSWLILRWRDSGHSTDRLVLISFILGLTGTNHLMGVLVAPALLVFVLLVDHRALLRPRFWLGALPAVAVALTVQFFLPLRAAQKPIIAQGQPECATVAEAVRSVYTWGGGGCEALSAMLSRDQYGKPSVLLDPSVFPQQVVARTIDQVGSQLLNYLQYFDWQWARGISGADPVLGGLRPLVTLLFLGLGIAGARSHWRRDRHSAAFIGTLFFTLSVGLVGYMNFRYGLALDWARFPERSMHEVRERDYFFLIGFSVWGLWAGMGLVEMWSWAAGRVSQVVSRPWLVTSPALAFAILPLALNWSWATRADDYTPRDFAYNVLMGVEPYGVLVTNGDNDTFPLWYLQEVEGIRRDVTVMVGEYLNTPWYVKQLRQLTEPCPPGVDPLARPTRIVCQRPMEGADLPAALVQAGWGQDERPPPDSVFPLSDEEIDAIASQYIITDRPLAFNVGKMEATIEAGTPLLPADTFVAAMLRATAGERPIHFMPGSSTVSKLGLWDYTVRQGLTWRIAVTGLPPEDDGGSIVHLPESRPAGMAGAAIDLPLTEFLLSKVYLRRGRILDPSAPWVDAATINIPAQYVFAHLAAGYGHSVEGAGAEAERQFRQAEWWEGVLTN